MAICRIRPVFVCYSWIYLVGLASAFAAGGFAIGILFSVSQF
jgi:hypothetical protein